MAYYFVWYGRAPHRDSYKILLGVGQSFSYRLRHFVRLSETKSHMAML